MHYTHIVFDVDGTLVNSELADTRSLADTIFHFLGRRVEPKTLSYLMGIPGKETLEQLGFPNPAEAERYWEQRLTLYAEPVILFDGIPELVDTLLARGLHIGLVTSRTHSQLEADFGKLPLRQKFHTVICADDTALRKPHPDPLLKFMADTGAEVSRTLFIGDSAYDSQCAAAAGVDFILAGWGTHDPTLPAMKVCAAPSEVLTTLVD